MRIQFEVADEIVTKIDSYAKQSGLNRSTFIKVCIGDKLMMYDKAYGLIEKMGYEMLEKENEK